MRASEERAPLLVLSLAAGIAVAPLVFYGPSYGHDFDFHLLNWMEAARQFSHGNLHPSWAYSPAYNAGEPRFVFYPPLSWTVGALLGLLLSHFPAISPESAWTAVPVVYTWICLVASGVAMYRVARHFAGSNAALIGSVLYLANPYMLFAAYERTAYAELLAAALMPLLLFAALSERVRASRIAVPIALLWLTNAPAAVIGCYTLAILVILRLVFGSHRTDSLLRVLREVALPAAAGLVIGVGLAAFYFIPAAWERRFVQVSMATILEMRIDHNFLFEHTGTSADAVTHDQVLRTASWIAITLVLAGVATLVACWIQQRRGKSIEPGTQRLPVGILLSLVGIIAVLLTPVGNPVWQHAPELRFLQFPWRFLTVVTPVFALAVAAALSTVRLNRLMTVAVTCLSEAALVAFAYLPFHQVCDPDESIASQMHAFQQSLGAEPTDEYTPQTADNDALTPGKPGYWLAAVPSAPAPPNSQPGITPPHFSVTAPRAEYLILNLRNYPAWRVELNGERAIEREQRRDGLIAIPIPPGTSTIDLRYARMLDDKVGISVSIVSVLILLGLHRREKHLDV
ncbi:MAG TPA: 6-pyruvoyl-tetrahydropterin synthase-related protein [Acidobacteriaceae bacterium]|jgi:hypothetical protein|nr:6-pyruvoyl-tetrahydropterin synthase-related protein [Acidobacteriaceae bacterium]